MPKTLDPIVAVTEATAKVDAEQAKLDELVAQERAAYLSAGANASETLSLRSRIAKQREALGRLRDYQSQLRLPALDAEIAQVTEELTTAKADFGRATEDRRVKGRGDNHSAYAAALRDEGELEVRVDALSHRLQNLSNQLRKIGEPESIVLRDFADCAAAIAEIAMVFPGSREPSSQFCGAYQFSLSRNAPRTGLLAQAIGEYFQNHFSERAELRKLLDQRQLGMAGTMNGRP